jgi:hypothetical protein
MRKRIPAVHLPQQNKIQSLIQVQNPSVHKELDQVFLDVRWRHDRKEKSDGAMSELYGGCGMRLNREISNFSWVAV